MNSYIVVSLGHPGLFLLFQGISGDTEKKSYDKKCSLVNREFYIILFFCMSAPGTLQIKTGQNGKKTRDTKRLLLQYI